MTNTTKKAMAFCLLLSLLLVGTCEFIHGALFGGSTALPLSSLLAKAAMAEGNEDAEAETALPFSVFNENTINALNTEAKEVAVITLPGSGYAFTFVSHSPEEGTEWLIGKDMYFAYGSAVDEDGTACDYMRMFHFDKKKGITRTLEQIIPEDGEHEWFISKADKKGTVEYPLTAEQFADAEQRFANAKTFDSLFETTRKSIERDSVLYLFSQETFDELEAVGKLGVKVTFPGRDDIFTFTARQKTYSNWNIYSKSMGTGLAMVYGFSRNENDEKHLVQVIICSFGGKSSKTLATSLLGALYSEDGNPTYYIGKTPVEKKGVRYEITESQFVNAVLQFRADTRKFDALYNKLKNAKNNIPYEE